MLTSVGHSSHGHQPRFWAENRKKALTSFLAKGEKMAFFHRLSLRKDNLANGIFCPTPAKKSFLAMPLIVFGNLEERHKWA